MLSIKRAIKKKISTVEKNPVQFQYQSLCSIEKKLDIYIITYLLVGFFPR